MLKLDLIHTSFGICRKMTALFELNFALLYLADKVVGLDVSVEPELVLGPLATLAGVSNTAAP